jgi:hypothetical protein
MTAKRARPQDVSGLDAAEFGIAFQLALDAGQNSDNVSSSSPYERASFALKRHFADRTDDFISADYRFHALMDLYIRNVLADWVRRPNEASSRTEIHPAVLDTASRLRLASNGKFPVRKFLQEVAETARRHYADLEQWPLGETPRS